ncbi:MAG: ThuA domain-containing protein [Planctomycetota bacterium]
MFHSSICAAFLAIICVVPSYSLVMADEDGQKRIVMLVAEREYDTDQSLKAFAGQYLQDYKTTIVLADTDDRNSLSGIEALETADLMVVSVRRRTLPKDQLDRIRDFVKSGKPVIGLRTASHAFSLRGKPAPKGRAGWPEFDAQVFGGNYTNHHGNSLQTSIELPEKTSGETSSILAGIRSALPAPSGGSLYRVSPLAANANVLLIGRVPGAEAEPVAWTFIRKDGGKSFYTSLGHTEDFGGPVLPKLLKNAIQWSLAGDAE